ncbi:deoxyribose-phosphate aldolase [Alloprevotella sp. OH1205_COT-284]|uniref:deoxyribose-phosphate aldolase n=1 Tax=Alloprevotella sp. OH1205_COT-284 TaxID=2491043 RepID=UPI000F5F2C93|nr:deoxyribose-phosphate aldolase [Alloprevotella sp. OH1205_COT-284]RRD80852.1 deoxyribose-phosphate aldolase [Alloprevotella sp. OH1205_COT-284]
MSEQHQGELHQTDKYEQTFALYDMNLDDAQVSAAVRKIVAENREKYNTPEVLKTLLSTVELTTLTVTDSQESVLQFTENVNRWSDAHPDLPPLATICVYPNFASTVSQSLEADGVKVACVSGGFPASQTFLEVKTVETSLALADGADEIDMVLSVGTFQSGDYETCADEIAELKDVCGDRALKVILETGELKTASEIKKASILSMYAGADFIKTSTGKVAVAATPEAAYVMCNAIKEYHEKTGRLVGFKAAGGIKTVDEAVDFYTIVAEVLGEEFCKDGHFRIGTSRLANLLASAILGEDITPFSGSGTKY